MHRIEKVLSVSFAIRARPPLASENLRCERGIIIYRLPKPSPDGMMEIQFLPEEFIERISRFIPSPKTHRRHYHGVFAPHYDHLSKNEYRNLFVD